MAAATCERDSHGGWGLVAARDLMAGEVVIEERPLVAVPDAGMRQRVCADCLRLDGAVVPCAGWCGGQAAVCEGFPQCAKSHGGSRHADVCWAFGLVDAGLYPEAFELLGLVVHAALLEGGAPFDALWGMSTGGSVLSPDEEHACAIVSSALSSSSHPDEIVRRLALLRSRVTELLSRAEAAAPSGSSSAPSTYPSLSILSGSGAEAGIDPVWGALVRGVCLRDKTNDFALGCPVQPGEDPEVRVMRASAVLPLISRTNHSCIPNVVRFDRFDAEACPQDSTSQLIAMVDIAQGMELTLSYLPLNNSALQGGHGRKRLSEEYGFLCACAKCRLEERTGEDEEEEQEMNGDVTETPGYLYFFFLKHRCDACGGTLSPHLGRIPHLPDGVVCNRCGKIRTGPEFEALVQREFEEDESSSNDESSSEDDPERYSPAPGPSNIQASDRPRA